LDPDFLAALTRLSEVATATRTLPVKTMAFIRLAADISTTGIFEPAARLHVRTALEHGATVEELLEVLQLVSVVGLHSCTFGGPILFDEWEKSLALAERGRTRE
jgi:alkylhydroperoxidase/carboxymuconolactone decarboxylase family protein YurZ